MPIHDSLSLDVPKGELFGFLGPNGAGKSTIINVLTGQLVPDAGTARIAGVDGLAIGLSAVVGGVDYGLFRLARPKWT